MKLILFDFQDLHNSEALTTYKAVIVKGDPWKTCSILNRLKTGSDSRSDDLIQRQTITSKDHVFNMIECTQVKRGKIKNEFRLTQLKLYKWSLVYEDHLSIMTR
jgi:hypothetical protein